MADENHTSNSRSTPRAVEAAAEALHEAIEEERSRLMKAESVLDCALIAMDEFDGVRSAYYPNAVELARDVVKEAINRLDSVRLRPRIEKLLASALQEASEKGGSGPSGHEVREPTVAYLV